MSCVCVLCVVCCLYVYMLCVMFFDWKNYVLCIINNIMCGVCAFVL